MHPDLAIVTKGQCALDTCLVKNNVYLARLGKNGIISVPDQNSEIGTDLKQPKA